MARHADLQIDVAAGGNGAQPAQEIAMLGGNLDRPPAHLTERQRAFVAAWRGANKPAVGRFEAAAVLHRRADAIEPGSLVGGARRGEGRAAELFRVKAERRLLRRI